MSTIVDQEKSAAQAPVKLERDWAKRDKRSLARAVAAIRRLDETHGQAYADIGAELRDKIRAGLRKRVPGVKRPAAAAKAQAAFIASCAAAGRALGKPDCVRALKRWALGVLCGEEVLLCGRNLLNSFDRLFDLRADLRPDCKIMTHLLREIVAKLLSGGYGRTAKEKEKGLRAAIDALVGAPTGAGRPRNEDDDEDGKPEAPPAPETKTEDAQQAKPEAPPVPLELSLREQLTMMAPYARGEALGELFAALVIGDDDAEIAFCAAAEKHAPAGRLVDLLCGWSDCLK